MTTLITGTTGFVGTNLCSTLAAQNHQIRRVIRSGKRLESRNSNEHQVHLIDDINIDTDWSAALAGINCIIHCAARSKVLNENAVNSLAAYRIVNVDGTLNLAKQAVQAGVRRFIFLSSIKVNGEQSIPGDRITSRDNASPENAYSISKWEAEQALHELSAKTGLDVVIIRPPLVYGSGVKGNFLSLLSWLNKGIPLPLGAIQNKRSLVCIDNLIDLVTTCIDHPAATNQTFLVSDDEDISTTELLKRLGNSLGKPARLLPIPFSLFQLSAELLGKKDVTQRLLGNLQVDISHTKETLGWAPPVSMEEGLGKTAQWYLDKF